VLGNDPAVAAARSAQDAVTAFAAPGTLEMLVHHPFGEVPGEYVLYLRLVDNTIHDWDLMQAVGIDEPVDPEALSVLYATALAAREAIRASGHFGPAEVPVGEDAD